MAPAQNRPSVFAFREAGDVYYKEHQEYDPGKPYWGGKTVSVKEQEWGGIKAINPETGKIEWVLSSVYTIGRVQETNFSYNII